MTILSILGLYFGFTTAVTILAIVEDYREARAEMRRARVARPVISLARCVVVRR